MRGEGASQPAVMGRRVTPVKMYSRSDQPELEKQDGGDRKDFPRAGVAQARAGSADGRDEVDVAATETKAATELVPG